MIFNSISFLIFLSLFFTSLLFFRNKWKFIYLSYSFIFYGYYSISYLFLLLLICFQTYYLGNLIYGQKKKFYLILNVFFSLFILCFFKYYNFFINQFFFSNENDLKNSYQSIALPVGISFYIFQSISYFFDLYRQELKKQKIIDIFIYISFFPQLFSGPILRARNFINQISYYPLFNLKNLKKGIILILWGFFLKLCLADNLGLYVDTYYEKPYEINLSTLFVCIFFYSFQIYGDFCGYSLIAIGLLKILNINVPVNFNFPYFSKSISEFWRRWHISLSKFFKDYLYIPLGGSRLGKLRGLINVFIVMFLAGLWHGANQFFVLWGVLHGFIIILEKIFNYEKIAINKNLKLIITFIIVSLLWIPFRINDLDIMRGIVNLILNGNLDLKTVFSKFEVINNLFLIFIVIVIENFFYNKKKVVKIINSEYLYIFTIIFLFNLILIFGKFHEKTYIYFQF